MSLYLMLRKIFNVLCHDKKIWHPKNSSKHETDESRAAVVVCRDLYEKFNRAENIELTNNQIDCIRSLSADDFIQDVVGSIKSFNVIALLFKIKFSHVRNIAWNIYRYISDPENVVHLYKQAIERNKIVIDLGSSGKFHCNQTLYAHHKIFMRFKNKSITFWLIQHFKFYGIYFPQDRIYFSLKDHGKNIKHEKCIGNFHYILFDLFEKLIQWDSAENESTFYGLLLSYIRPFHFFADMLPSANLLISNEEIKKNPLKKFITLNKESFYSPKRFFGSDCECISFDASKINEYLIENHLFILQPVRNVSKNFNYFNISKNYYKKIIKKSHESSLENLNFQETLKEAKLATPLLWFGVCNERRSWAEGTEGICKMVEKFKKSYPNTGLIIDGLTASEEMSQDQFQEKYPGSEAAIFSKIAAALPTTKIINAIGLKSYEKIALASHVDFFLTCFLTDSLYVAQIHSKPGLAYGSATATPIGHRHPLTVILPQAKVIEKPIGYSINPDEITKASLKIFEQYQELKNHQHNLHILLPGKGFSLEQNFERNSISIISNLKQSTHLAAGGTSCIYPITSRKYLFRFEAFSNLGSTLHIFAYKHEKKIFKTKGFEAGKAAYVTFPPKATHFRLLIQLAGQDELEFFDIHWNTDTAVGSVRLGGYLDLEPREIQ